MPRDAEAALFGRVMWKDPENEATQGSLWLSQAHSDEQDVLLASLHRAMSAPSLGMGIRSSKITVTAPVLARDGALRTL
jgi:hypothetical protein